MSTTLLPQTLTAVANRAFAKLGAKFRLQDLATDSHAHALAARDSIYTVIAEVQSEFRWPELKTLKFISVPSSVPAADPFTPLGASVAGLSAEPEWWELGDTINERDSFFNETYLLYYSALYGGWALSTGGVDRNVVWVATGDVAQPPAIGWEVPAFALTWFGAPSIPFELVAWDAQGRAILQAKNGSDKILYSVANDRWEYQTAEGEALAWQQLTGQADVEGPDWIDSNNSPVGFITVSYDQGPALVIETWVGYAVGRDAYTVLCPLPEDYMRPIGAMGAEYEVEGGYVAARVGGTLSLQYLRYSVVPAEWSAQLLKCVYYKLAMELCLPVTQATAMKKGLLQEYEQLVFPQAKRICSYNHKSKSKRPRGMSSYAQARNGGRAS